MRAPFAISYILPASQCPTRRCAETGAALGINNHRRFGCSSKDRLSADLFAVTSV